MITNSLEWPNLSAKLRHQSRDKIKTWHNLIQVLTMLNNIDRQVSELSKIEVIARQRCSNHYTEDALNKINNDIAMVRDYILVGILIG